MVSQTIFNFGFMHQALSNYAYDHKKHSASEKADFPTTFVPNPPPTSCVATQKGKNLSSNEQEVQYIFPINF